MADESTSPFEFMFPSEIWGPVSSLFSSSMSLASFVLFWLMIIAVAATYVDATKEIPGAWNPWVIFWLVLLNGILILVIAWWFSPLELPYVGEVLSSAPNTCIGKNPGEYGSLEGGLCYKNCRDGYHGFGVRCYADTINIGAAIFPGLAHKDADINGGSWCPKDWHDDGLLCRAPLGWNSRCVDWGFGNWSGCATGGQVELKQQICPGPQDFGGDYMTEYSEWKRANAKGAPVPGETLVEANAANRKTCADVDCTNDKHWDNIDGLCYKSCPSGMQHVPGMPYLCFKGGELSYDRGGGRAPPMFRLMKKYAVDIPPHIPVDNTAM